MKDYEKKYADKALMDTLSCEEIYIFYKWLLIFHSTTSVNEIRKHLRKLIKNKGVLWND